jgi:hypothetical protein
LAGIRSALVVLLVSIIGFLFAFRIFETSIEFSIKVLLVFVL